MKPKRYKTITGLIRYTNPKRFRDLFAQAERDRLALIAKFAKDPKHKHVREKIGEVAHVWPGERTVMHRFYWCRICHADMDGPQPKH